MEYLQHTDILSINFPAFMCSPSHLLGCLSELRSDLESQIKSMPSPKDIDILMGNVEKTSVTSIRIVLPFIKSFTAWQLKLEKEY